MTDEQVDKVARALCRESCAFYGDPPCWKVEPESFDPDACDPGCGSLALAAIAAMQPSMDEVEARAYAEGKAEGLREAGELEPVCDICGHPCSNHPFRHPFRAAIKKDKP